MGLPARAEDPYEVIDDLQERVRQLEALISGDVDVLRYEHMTPQCRRVLNALMRHELCCRGVLEQAAFGFRRYDLSEGAVLVIISHLRKVLAKHRVEIRKRGRSEWYLSPDDKERLRAE